MAWRASLLANLAYATDQCETARQRRADPYCDILGYGRSKAADSAVAAYAEIKRAWVARARDSEAKHGEPDLLVDMLVPAVPAHEEAFLEAFFEADALPDVCVQLDLDSDACTSLVASMRPLQDPVATYMAHTSADDVVGRFEHHATRVHLASFLGQMARFYDVTDRVPDHLQVEVLIGTENRTRATVIGKHVVLPVAPGKVADEQLFDLMGVVVHEVGHRFLGAIRDDQRKTVNEAIARCCGIIQSHHHNILDESTQTALGNVLFSNWAFPGELNFEGNLYSYETDNDVPHAIDNYARALVPVLARHLSTDGGFSRGYLADALGQHRLLFEAEPSHHTRAGFVVASEPQAAAIFRSQFWGRSRASFLVSDADAVQRAVDTYPMVPQWVLLVGDTDEVQELAKSSPAVDSAGRFFQRLSPGEACFRAFEPTIDRGWSFIVAARDLDALRTILGALHQRKGIPASLCVR